MVLPEVVCACCVCMPGVLMLVAVFTAQREKACDVAHWRTLIALAMAALLFSVIAAIVAPGLQLVRPWLQPSQFGAVLAVLVQLLGTVIAAFSSRYLEGEPRQRDYMAALAGVLGAVHLLLLADHWVVLILAWALVGGALQHLLCFYANRPFAQLAAHKKRAADRLADGLLLGAAALAWGQVGSGSLTDLGLYLARHAMSTAMHASAMCLVLAVILRTALFPVHGWLIQVMEAPTPVSALLHAGVVNLGGFVLIRFAPLLEHATAARILLTAFGLGTAMLAGLVALTRISVKVRLAWSTVAQMGFMVLECGLGLYTLAAMHLIGHSLYKAHAFLSASSTVRSTRLQIMRAGGAPPTSAIRCLLAPAASTAAVVALQALTSPAAWPWWWSAVMGFAWAPLLWWGNRPSGYRARLLHGIAGLLMICALTGVALLAHAIPLGIHDVPHPRLGLLALTGMASLYGSVAVIQLRPHAMRGWRRWSYAGFYVDELYTRMTLQLWPTQWTR